MATNQKTNNYFTFNVQKFGDNFIAQRSAQDIQKDAKRKLFKDMVFGNIDYDVYGKYFTDANFLDNLITVAMNERDVHMVTSEALRQYDFNNPGNSIVSQKAIQHLNTAQALNTIYNCLINIKSNNMNIMFLTGIATAVYAWKRDFAEFY